MNQGTHYGCLIQEATNNWSKFMAVTAYVQFTFHPNDELGGVLHCGEEITVSQQSDAEVLLAIKKNNPGSDFQIQQIKWQKNQSVENSGLGLRNLNDMLTISEGSLSY